MKSKTLTLTPETTLQDLLALLPPVCRLRTDIDLLAARASGAKLDWSVNAEATAVALRDTESILPLNVVDETGRTVLTYKCVSISGAKDLMRGMPRRITVQETRYVGKRTDQQTVEYVQRTAELRVLHKRLKDGHVVRANDPNSTKIETEEPTVLAHLDRLLG
jgi:hypothetical protein